METTPIKKKLDIDFVNYIFLATIFLLLVASLCINHIVSYVAFMGFCIGACFLPEKTIVCDLFFLMPFASIFKPSSDSTSFFTLCELIILLIFFIKGNKLTLNILIIGGIYVAYLALCKIFIHDSEIFGVIKQGMNIVLLFYFVRIYPTQEYKKLSLFFIVGMLLSSFIALFADYIPNFYEFVKRIGGDSNAIENRFTGLNGDPNYYSVNIILAFGLLISLYYKKDISKLLFWGIFVALSVFGLLTYSKSFLLMYAIVCLIVLVLTIKTKDVIGFGVLVLLGAGVLALAFIEGSVVQLTIKRLLEADDLDALTTHRSTLWKKYVQYLLDNPTVLFFGAGITITGPVSHGIEKFGSHNAYIDIIFRLGVFGTIIFIGAIIVCFMEIKKNKKTPLNFLGISLGAIMYFFLGMLTAYEMIFQFFLAYLLFVMPFNSKNKQVREEISGVQ